MVSLLALVCVVGAYQNVDADRRLDWFRQARVGMFIHWGPVSLKGTEIGWSRGDQVPAEEYDALYRRFDPEAFDADAWMALAKDSGMRYVVPTAKHHDGFCLWPTKTSDYSIANTPFKRDIMGEIAAAAKKNGVAMCSYYSILDWHDPRYGTGSPGGSVAKPNPDMPAFLGTVKAQLAELVNRYQLKMLWFDGQWEKPYRAPMAKDLETYVRGLDPKLVVNNRVGKAESDGDYDTPEQKVGSFQRGRAWETCMTLCQQWAWKPNDRMKSLDEVIRILVETVTGDGNLLLNVGPMPDGRIEPRQADRLRELGSWLKKYGESVYGTRGGPYVNGPWGGSTCKEKTVYLHLLGPVQTPFRLPALPAKILRSKCLTGGTALVRQDADGVTVETQATTATTDTIVKLEIDRNALDIVPISLPKG